MMGNRAGRHAGPNARADALSRELEVGDVVLYRRGSYDMDQLGVIERVEEKHYWICTREGASIRIVRYGQCVFYPSPEVIAERAKAVRATWTDDLLRRRMGLSPVKGVVQDESVVAFIADPNERRRRRAHVSAY